MRHSELTTFVFLTAAVASLASYGRAFVLADRGYAAPFFLGQDDPVSARSAVELEREIMSRIIPYLGIPMDAEIQ